MTKPARKPRKRAIRIKPSELSLERTVDGFNLVFKGTSGKGKTNWGGVKVTIELEGYWSGPIHDKIKGYLKDQLDQARSRANVYGIT